MLIKLGLEDIPALLFAGLRYGLAFLCLLSVFFHSKGVAELRRLPRIAWLKLITLGIIYYALTQGA